eukprot:4398642-Amphidinium_carterae.1
MTSGSAGAVTSTANLTDKDCISHVNEHQNRFCWRLGAMCPMSFIGVVRLYLFALCNNSEGVSLHLTCFKLTVYSHVASHRPMQVYQKGELGSAGFLLLKGTCEVHREYPRDDGRTCTWSPQQPMPSCTWARIYYEGTCNVVNGQLLFWYGWNMKGGGFFQ